MKHITKKLALILLAIGLATGCAGRQPPDSGNTQFQAQNNNDPFESFNRSMFKLNNFGDKYMFVPIARAYQDITPKPVRTGVYNFFENLLEPRNIVNNLLQGKFLKAGTATGRLVLNTGFGLLGTIDLASALKIPKVSEDLGQTLAVWGVPSGPYLVLPIFGPRNTRGFAGMFGDAYLYPPLYLENDTWKYGLTIVDLIASRERLLGMEELLDLQLDPYVFLRESYRQKREAEIRDSTGQSGFDDEFDDDFDDEFDDEPVQQ